MVTVCEVGRIHLTAPAAAIAPTTCTMTYRMPATTLVLPVSIAATVMAGLNCSGDTPEHRGDDRVRQRGAHDDVRQVKPVDRSAERADHIDGEADEEAACKLRAHARPDRISAWLGVLFFSHDVVVSFFWCCGLCDPPNVASLPTGGTIRYNVLAVFSL